MNKGRRSAPYINYASSAIKSDFFTAFLIINYNRKKQKEREEAIKNRPHGYYGDDTV